MVAFDRIEIVKIVHHDAPRCLLPVIRAIGVPVDAFQTRAVAQMEPGHRVGRPAARTAGNQHVVCGQIRQGDWARARFSLRDNVCQRLRQGVLLRQRPAAQTRHRGQRDKVCQVRPFTAQFLYNLLDQEVAK